VKDGKATINLAKHNRTAGQDVLAATYSGDALHAASSASTTIAE
jgi:hypothetical protein